MSENFLKLLEKWQQYPVDYETNDRKEIDALTTSAFVWCKVEDNEDQTMIDVLDAILENHTKMKAAQRTKIIRDLRLTLEYKVTPKTYREFMSAWSQKFQANITLDRQFSLMGEESDDGAIFNAVFLKAGEHGVFAAKEQLKAAYNDWKVGCEKANKAAFIKRIEYSPNANVNVWDEFINSFLRDDHIPNEEDRVKYRKMVKAVLMGFVWRIKNKMLGRPTSNHIMAYFRSKQGAGKTNMMKWFLDPVDDGTTWTTFEMFDHDEKQNQLRHSPVIVMDEMAKAEKTDSGKLKNMMTADFTSFRKLYGEAGKGRVLSTLLGAGNFDLTEILPDTSGLRRFFQIEVFKDFWKRDVQYDHLDALDLWKSVDENAVSPIETADMIEMLIEYQGQHKTKSPIEDWLDHVCENGKFAHVDKKNGVETAYYYEATDLFSDYKIWATSRFPNDRSNQLSFTRALGRILRDGEWAYDTHNDNKTRRVCYRIGHHVEGKTDMTGKILPFMSPQTITGFAIEK